MENLALVSSTSPQLALSYSGLKNPTREIPGTRKNSSFAIPFARPNFRVARGRTSRLSVSARTAPTRIIHKGTDRFARIFSSSSSAEQTSSSVAVNPNLSLPPPSSNFGSPLFWIGVGVGCSALFSFVASRLKQYAMQQALKTMMNQMNTQNNNQFTNAAFSPGSPFPFPPPPTSGPTTPPPSQASSKPRAALDVSATKVETAPANDVKDETKVKNEPKKYAFVDVSPEETIQRSPFNDFEEVTETSSSKEESQFAKAVSQNGAAFKQGVDDSQWAQSTGKTGPAISVEDLEKMMEDPKVQQMVFPYLPEEMRNPTTFKWMMQNPQYRQQLEDMLNNMRGSPEWDNRMMDTLKNFDLNSPEVKQQFDQIGLTPEEVISKIMANPDVAMAFQNPKVQAAIMDCSQNPLSIAKYQNDREVMDVFNKISELFPGVTG